MKKWIMILAVITLITLPGCTRPSSQEVQTEPDKQHTYKALNLYLLDSSNSSELPTDLGIVPAWDDDMRVTEINMPSLTFSIGKIQTIGKYNITKTFTGHKVTPTRYYLTEYGDVGVDVASGNIVEVRFHTSTLIDTDPNADILTEDQCEQIALEFLKTVLPNTDLDDYTQTKQGLRTINEGFPYSHRIYTFCFDKYVNGLGTTDHIGICVTEYGSIIFYRRGDSIDEQKIIDLNIDKELIDSMVTEYANHICDLINKDATFTIHTPSYIVLQNGIYALQYAILYSYTDNGENMRSGTVIFVPLEDG